MISHIFCLCFISFLISNDVSAELGSSCCTMNVCSMEKIGIVSQLMTLATQIQNSARKSESCGATSNSPSTTLTTTSTEPTSTEPTTTIRNWRYGNYMTGGTQQEAIDDCIWRGLELLSLEGGGEFEEFREYMKLHIGRFTASNNDLYIWTSGMKDTFGVWRWSTAGGSPIDPNIVSSMQVAPGQEYSTSLILVYSPPVETLTPMIWNGTDAWFNGDYEPIHGVCETNN